MSNKKDVIEIAKVTNRNPMPLKAVNVVGDFESLHAAEAFMKAKGYSVGTLCGDAPIACVRGKVSYIAKWYNIAVNEWQHIDAVIVAKDMRNGIVFCYEFVK